MELCASYCWCGDLDMQPTQDMGAEYYNSKKMKMSRYSSDQFDRSTNSEALEPVKERRRKTNLPTVDATLKRIMKLIEKNKTISFRAHDKSSRGLHNGTSKRRSKFIGVLKNGFRWQVLINAGKSKKYIGTYCEEKEAALVHDFYAIGLNGLKANTNFTYDQQIIVDMISDYYANDKMFNPTIFADRVQ